MVEQKPSITIFVDNDSCPVKEEIIKVATRYQSKVVFVGNQGMRPIRLPGISQIVVSAAFDAADDRIFSDANSGDIVITADILLAGRCIGKGCKVLNHNGNLFTPQNIGSALAMRELNSYLREAGEIKGNNPSFSKQHRSQFLQALDLLLCK